MGEKFVDDVMELPEEIRARVKEQGMGEVESGEIIKWEKGKSVSGRFLGFKEGPKGMLFKLGIDSGDVFIYGCPSVLESKLQCVPSGRKVEIFCKGQYGNKAGQPTWDFIVFQAKEERNNG